MALISKGNRKIGSIANTSFPPVITCRKNAPCATDGCYALKFYKMYPSTRKAWDDNWALYKEAPCLYWKKMREAFKMERYFRYFVSGDIPDYEYALEMVLAADENPHCEFLCFTKQYEIVNRVYEECTEWPKNLHILFSGWEGLKPDNPHNFPETAVITKDMETVPDEWLICGGNCTDCACRGVGCWQVKSGQTIAFHKH